MSWERGPPGKAPRQAGRGASAPESTVQERGGRGGRQAGQQGGHAEPASTEPWPHLGGSQVPFLPESLCVGCPQVLGAGLLGNRPRDHSLGTPLLEPSWGCASPVSCCCSRLLPSKGPGGRAPGAPLPRCCHPAFPPRPSPETQAPLASQPQPAPPTPWPLSPYCDILDGSRWGQGLCLLCFSCFD